jgi:hypothetical protein
MMMTVPKIDAIEPLKHGQPTTAAKSCKRRRHHLHFKQNEQGCHFHKRWHTEQRGRTSAIGGKWDEQDFACLPRCCHATTVVHGARVGVFYRGDVTEVGGEPSVPNAMMMMMMMMTTEASSFTNLY